MDLACGTGELTVKLAEEDFEVTGWTYQRIC